MRSFLKYAAVLLFLVGFSSMSPVSGQNCLKGTVLIETSNQPLSGVNILVEGHRGCTSGANGTFELCNLPHDTLKVVCSHIGYETMSLNLMPGMGSISVRLIPRALEMNEIVVTATRTDNSLMNTPMRVNVVTPKLLENSAVQSVDEVLKYIPGINWSRPFGIFSTKAIVSMRGLSGKEQGRVLVLLDGVPLNKSDGGTVDWNLVDLDMVRKIEITKGAGSALYGGNAMGGVINILTRQPEEPFRMNASVEYGTYNTCGARINAGGKRMMKQPARSWYWNAGTFYKQSDGYITQSPADVRANPYIVKSNMLEFGSNLKAGINFNDRQHLEAFINYYNDHRGTGEKVYLKDGNVTDHDSYGLTFRYTGESSRYKYSFTLFDLTENYKKVNEYLKDDYTWYNVLSARQDIGATVTVSKPLGDFQLATAGFDVKNGSVDAYDKYFTSTDIVYNKGKMTTTALYLQDEIKLLNERLRMVIGIRYDMATFYDGSFRIEAPSLETTFMQDYQAPDMPTQHWNAFSPRVSAQYKLGREGKIYGMYSRGFRPSVLDDLCRSGRIKGGFKIANPSLKPEYLTNYETGIDLVPLKSLYFNSSVYYSIGKDFQYYVSNGQTIDMGFGDRPIFIRANISEVEISGIETELRYTPSELVNLTANYSFTRSLIKSYHKIASNDTIDLSGKYFTDVPEHIFTIGLNLEPKWIHISTYFHYNGAMYINDQNSWDEILLSSTYPAYTTIDLKCWKEFQEHYKIAINVQNLLDVKYYDSKDAVCPGRFITVSFTYK